MLICFVVALGATAVGAASGLGGGMLIKPALDAVGGMAAAAVSFMSACTVLAMSVVALCTRRADLKSELDARLVFLACGSAAGGVVGKRAFASLARAVPAGPFLAVQSGMVCALGLGILLYMAFRHRVRPKNIQGRAAPLAAGLLLGALASFLGIGGGPVNVIALAWLFSMTARQAALGSIFVIFFSQTAGVAVTLLGGAPTVEAAALAVMIAGGVAGGIIGGRLGRRLDERRTSQLFTATVAVIAMLSGFNLAGALV